MVIRPAPKCEGREILFAGSVWEENHRRRPRHTNPPRMKDAPDAWDMISSRGRMVLLGGHVQGEMNAAMSGEETG